MGLEDTYRRIADAMREGAEQAERFPEALRRTRRESDELLGSLARPSGGLNPAGSPTPAGLFTPGGGFIPLAPSGGGGRGGSSSGGAGGAGGSARTRAGGVRAFNDPRTTRSEDFLNQFCERTTVRIPRPGNLYALQTGDLVDAQAWRCPDGSVFLVPGQFESLPGAASRGSGGAGDRPGGGGGRRGPRFRVPNSLSDDFFRRHAGQGQRLINNIIGGNAAAGAVAASGGRATVSAPGVEAGLARQTSLQESVVTELKGIHRAVEGLRDDDGGAGFRGRWGPSL